MSWLILTEAQVLTKLSGPEVAAVKAAALAPGQENPLPAIIEQIVGEVRGYVGACPDNILGPAGTIPPELEGAALSRIRFELATRLPVKSLLTDDRREANRTALSLLRDVARCDFALVPPDEAGEQPRPTPEAFFGSNPKVEM